MSAMRPDRETERPWKMTKTLAASPPPPPHPSSNQAIDLWVPSPQKRLQWASEAWSCKKMPSPSSPYEWQECSVYALLPVLRSKNARTRKALSDPSLKDEKTEAQREQVTGMELLSKSGAGLRENVGVLLQSLELLPQPFCHWAFLLQGSQLLAR